MKPEWCYQSCVYRALFLFGNPHFPIDLSERHNLAQLGQWKVELKRWNIDPLKVLVLHAVDFFR